MATSVRMLKLWMLVYHVGSERPTQRSAESLKFIYVESEEEACAEALKFQERAQERGESLTFKHARPCPNGFILAGRRLPGKIPAPAPA